MSCCGFRRTNKVADAYEEGREKASDDETQPIPAVNDATNSQSDVSRTSGGPSTAQVSATEEGREKASDDETQPIPAVNDATNSRSDVSRTSGGPSTAQVKPQGMSLECLYKFISDHPDVREEGLTTSEINKKHVKKETEGTNQAYIHKYVGERNNVGKPFISTATVFVSHAWKYSFTEDVLDVLDQYEFDNPDSYFWFDLFANDQNGISKKDYNWFSETFRNSILSIGQVLLIMSPWDDPKPLTRAWCIFEIAASLEMSQDVQFTAMLPKSQIEPMVDGVLEDPSCIIRVLADIQAEKAEAREQSDKDTIFQTIQNTRGGFQHINEQIKIFLRGWYKKNLIENVNNNGSRYKDKLLESVGTVLYDLGDPDKALKYNQMALDIRLNTLGEDHPDTASSYNNIGSVYVRKGEYDEALEYYQRSLNIQLNTLGEDHTSTATSYNNIGEVYVSKGEYDKALEYFQRSLNIWLNTVGEDHPDTAASYNNIGQVYDSKGEYDKALEYYQRSLNIWLNTLGEDHPHTATSYNNIGGVYDSKGEYDKALEYYQRSLNIQLNTLGEDHPRTATSYNNIGVVYDSKGEYDKALEYYQRSLNIRLNTLGEDHPDTANSYNNIGSVYRSKGEYDKALEYYLKSANIRSNTLLP